MGNIEDYEGPQEKNGPAVEDGAVQELKKGGKDLQDIHRQVNRGSEDWMQVFKYLSILSVQKIHCKYVCQPLWSFRMEPWIFNLFLRLEKHEKIML